MAKNNGKTSVLVVDDLRSIRLTLGGILEDEGHNVVTVEDGYQAIEAVKKVYFDAIFMDIKMPGINGVQTFREVKKIAPASAVIMMTAYSVEDLVKEALEEGAYAIIYKPFDIDKVISLIEKLLRQKILILIVDEQFADRETLKTILEDKGYRVTTAKDGTEAIKKVREKHYDIIFLEVKLPDMNCAQTFEQVKEIDPGATVIMMSGYTEEELVKKAVSAGVYTCLQKPFDMEKVMALVADIARGRKQ
ncbi:MAG TPA: response regulator [Dehalococcoidales bacterium]|nr:response regulator [Dehalococcoidales bacterium]